MDKPRFPIKFFHLRLLYSERYSKSKTCGRRLVPKVVDGEIETPQNFNKRKSCGGPCRGALVSQAYAARTRSKEQSLRTSLITDAKNRPSATTVQDDEMKPSGLEEDYPPLVVHSEPPLLIDPEYGGPPAPESVAEEVDIFACEEAAEKAFWQKHEIVSTEHHFQRHELERAEEDAKQHINTASVSNHVPVTKDPRIGRAVRPVVMPQKPQAREPVPPPAQQGRLPDPRPPASFKVEMGKTLERADNGNCPTEGCGRPLNGFGKCGHCTQRQKWLEGQRTARINAAAKRD